MKLTLFRIAFRNLPKNRIYTFINLIGLTLGISFAFLIYIYVKHQLSYDNYIPQAENVYRISADYTISGRQHIYANAPRPLGATLVEEYPGIEYSVKMFGYNGLRRHKGLLWYNHNNSGDKYTHSNKAFLADTSFFEVFQLPLIEGDPRTALKAPGSIVLAKSVAQNLFGEGSAIGKQIRLEDNADVEVTGVFEDITTPTHIPFDVLISYQTYFDTQETEQRWYGAHVYTYVRTNPAFKPSDVNDNWQPFFEKYMKETFERLNGTAEIIFQPVTSLYLSQEYIWEPYPHGSKQNVYIFSIVGVFLLIVACFNYTNLSLSLSLIRSKEVGVRKSLGASKSSIRRQFLVESILTSLLASILSISFISVIFPTFNYLIQQNLLFNFIDFPLELIVLFALGLLIGIISGIYPAFYISSFRVSTVLKSIKSVTPKQNVSIRKVLVILQQAISIVLIICTFVVIDQLNFVRDMDTGFEKNDLVLINIRDTIIGNQLTVFEQDLRNISGVVNVSSTNDTPESGINEFSYELENIDGEFTLSSSQSMDVGLNFIETMQMKLLAGRVLTESDDEYRGLIINRFLAEKMGYTPEKAIGARLRFPGGDDQERKVVGVIENIIIGSATVPQQSLTLGYLQEQRMAFLIVRLEEGKQREVLASAQQLWEKYGSSFPFSYSFLDDQLDALLGKEDRLYNLLVFGSLLIIFISCLGIFGLVSYTALQRTKEIGIRKVLGAKSLTLYYVVIRDFLSSFFIAFLLATGLAWLIGSGWLDNFAYRTYFEWNNVLIAGIISIIITLFTLSYHTLQVIQTNPVDSLKE
ncbi:MAG: ABC transporter permease [Bacteroidota bacterium]